jgi:hypothetical protein
LSRKAKKTLTSINKVIPSDFGSFTPTEYNVAESRQATVLDLCDSHYVYLYVYSTKHLHHEIVLDLQTHVARFGGEQMAAVGEDFADDGRAAVLVEKTQVSNAKEMAAAGMTGGECNSRKHQSSSP